MAQTRQTNAIGDTANAVGDAAKGTFNLARSVFNGAKNTISYGISLVNRDGGVGATLGLAAGTAAAFFAGATGIVAGLPIIGGVIGTTLGVACCGAAVGAVAGGHLGKSRVEKEKTQGKALKQPTMLNKNAAMGFGLGAAGLAAVVGTVGTGGLLGAAAVIGGAALPVAGAYLGGQMGAQRMMKEYVSAQGQSASAAHSTAKAHAPAHHTQRSFKNSVSAEEWAQAESLMRDSSRDFGEGGRAAKLLADRAAAQAQPQAEQA